MKTKYTVIELSGCHMVGDYDFCCEGYEDDKARAKEYCDFLNLPPEQQTQAAFYKLAEVQKQQAIQKESKYGSPEHREAWVRICGLAKPLAGTNSMIGQEYRPEDY